MLKRRGLYGTHTPRNLEGYLRISICYTVPEGDLGTMTYMKVIYEEVFQGKKTAKKWGSGQGS